MENKEFTCWLIEAAWGRDVPYYLSTTTAGGHYFEWRPQPHLALKFADWDSADAVIFATRQLRPELYPSIVPMPSITEHVFFGDRGADHESEWRGATGKTQ